MFINCSKGPIGNCPLHFTTKWSLLALANNNTLPISRGFVNVALGAEKEQPISKNLNAEEVHKNGVQTASFHKLWTERDHVKTLFYTKTNSKHSNYSFVFHGGMQAIPSRLCTFVKYSWHAFNENMVCTPAGSPLNWQSFRPVCPLSH